jgi:hypothetical protein
MTPPGDLEAVEKTNSIDLIILHPLSTLFQSTNIVAMNVRLSSRETDAITALGKSGSIIIIIII